MASVQNCEFKLYHPDHPDHLWPDEFQTGSAVVWSLGTSEQHADWNIGVLRIPRSRDKIFMRTKLRSGNMPSADCHVRVLVVANLIPAIRIWDGLENDAPMKQDVRHPGQSRDVKFDSSVSLTHDTTILVPESHVEGKRLSLGYRERHYKVQVPEGSQHEHVKNNTNKLNTSQSRALSTALSLPNGISLIQGPPGTGKTTTVVEIIRSLCDRYDGRLLVCAPTNKAVQEVLERTHACWPTKQMVLVKGAVAEQKSILPKHELSLSRRTSEILSAIFSLMESASSLVEATRSFLRDSPPASAPRTASPSELKHLLQLVLSKACADLQGAHSQLLHVLKDEPCAERI